MSQQISLNKSMKINHSVKVLSILFVFLFAAVSAKAAGEVDPSFNAVPSIEAGTTLSGALALQSDGKIFVFGTVGSNNPFLHRLNPDGTVDTTFNCPVCNTMSVGRAVVQPDGKILVSGSYSGNGTPSALIIRVNPNGSLDGSFVYPFLQAGFSGSSSADVRAVLPDGKILFVLSQFFAGQNGSEIRRLNPNGSFDNTFTPISTGFFRVNTTVFSKILPLNNGKIFISTHFNSPVNGSGTGALARYNSDGTRDTSFESPAFSDSVNNRVIVADFELLPDGSILVAGKFTGVNGIARINLVKLLPAGNVDSTFGVDIAFLTSDFVTGIELLSNGQILITTNSRFYRLNQNGTVDVSFNSPSDLTNIGAWVFDAQNRIVLLGQFGNNKRYARLNADGSLDSAFNFEPIAPGTVRAIGVQPDGKAIVAGGFTKMNGVARSGLARLNLDGTLDPTFISGIGFDGPVNAIVVQPDGKILISGDFNFYNGTPRFRLARLNSNGTLDNGFTANVNSLGSVYTIALQPDGKILIGGAFSSINGAARNGVARLNADGTVDTAFNAGLAADAQVNAVLVQPDAKILIGGIFSGIGGFNRSNLARLNADGSLDAAFNAGNVSEVKLIRLQTDGKYVITGRNTVYRLNNNGSADGGFQTATFAASSGESGIINTILVDASNSIVVGGSFTTVNDVLRSRIVRLRPNGRIDTAFLPQGANRAVYALALQTEAKILVGGDFTIIGNVSRFGIARLSNTALRNITPYDFDGDGRADFTVFRPVGSDWYILNSSNNSLTAMHFGVSGDVIAPADYDGDGRTDIAVFRPTGAGEPSKAFFYIQQSRTNSFRSEQFGAQGDVPVSGDWDGDGTADLAVYRDGSRTGGQSYFFYRPSSEPGADFRTIAWGASGDKPVAGDYDGDGKSDAAVFRPTIARWFILRSSDNVFIERQFGLPTDIPVPADYDGDGKTNFAVYRSSNGTWYTSIDPATNYGEVRWGVATDIPVPADYDGDGRADIAVFRPDGGNWFVMRSASGFLGVQWGSATDEPAPAAYIP